MRWNVYERVNSWPLSLSLSLCGETLASTTTTTSAMSDSARVVVPSPSLLGLAIGGSQRGDRSPGREIRDDARQDVPTGTTHGDDAPYKAPSRSSHCRIIAVVRSLLLGIPSVLTSFCSLFFFFLDRGVFLVGAFLHLSPSISSCFVPSSLFPFFVVLFYVFLFLLLPSTCSRFFHRYTRPCLSSSVSLLLSSYRLNLLEILFSRCGNYKLSY